MPQVVRAKPTRYPRECLREHECPPDPRLRIALTRSVDKDVGTGSATRTCGLQRLPACPRDRDFRFERCLLHHHPDEAAIPIDVLPLQIAKVAFSEARLDPHDEELAKLAEPREA